MCPKVAFLRQVLYMISQRAPPYTLLARVMTTVGRWENITSKLISNTLNTAVGLCGPNLGFEAKDVFARSLHANGDMTPLCSGVITNLIKMIGR